MSDELYPYEARQTGRGIVIKGGKILLIERRWGDYHYYSIPGGGQENDEILEQTVAREIFEESSINVKVGRKLYDVRDPSGNRHSIFLCSYISGEPKIRSDSQEAQAMKKSKNKDIYKPTWIEITDLPNLPFLYWRDVSKELIKDIKQGWAHEPKLLSAQFVRYNDKP